MLFARFGVRAIGFISTIILARLLVPEDFGLVALAAVVVAGLEAMSELSFNVYLIANQGGDRRHYDTIWTLQIVRGLLIATILYFGAEWIAHFFEDERIADVAEWIALAVLISGFENTGIVDFQKDFRFSRDFVWMVGSKLVSFVVTVTLAIIWRDYWALVAGIIANRSARVVLSYTMHPLRPRPSLAGIREIFGFSGWLLANNLIIFVRNRSDHFVLAKLLGVGTLGIYKVAFDIVSLIGGEVLAPLRRALLPGYSKISSKPSELVALFLDSVGIVVLLMSPLAVGMALTSDLVVRILLGDKWLAAIPLIQILCAYAYFNAWNANTATVILALKRPAILTRITGITAVLIVPSLAGAAHHFGSAGAAAVVAATALLSLVLQWIALSNLLPIPLSEVATRLWRCMLSILVMTACVWLVQTETEPKGSIFLALGQLALQVIVGAVAYVSSLALLWQLSGRPNGPERAVLQFLLKSLRLPPLAMGRKA